MGRSKQVEQMKGIDMEGQRNRKHWQGIGKKGRGEEGGGRGLLGAPSGHYPKRIGQGGGRDGGESAGGKVPNGKERGAEPGMNTHPNGGLVERNVLGEGMPRVHGVKWLSMEDEGRATA